jgi:thymidylate synthase (FAD)
VQNDDEDLHDSWLDLQAEVLEVTKRAYRFAIENGIAKEQARAVLPEGMTESVMIMSGSLRSWVHYCQIRMDKATQKEHRIVAEQCWEIIGERFPAIIEALKDE